MADQISSLSKLEKSLGYVFSDKSFLIAALTHSSSSTSQRRVEGDNERLEFLGDRVLGLAICAELMAAFPLAREGELARRYNKLVRRQMCAEVAETIHLGEFLILSAGEARSGGREKSTILANAMEAILGAVFQDGGFAPACLVIKRLWHPHFNIEDDVMLDAKTALQEWAQGQGFDLPTYQAVGRSGPDHQPVFQTEVNVEGVGIGRGEGASKRMAEQMAAQDLLVQQKVWEPSS